MTKEQDPKSFEEQLGRLEEIVDELEGGEVPLERALALFEEGVKLGRSCGTRLDDAERRITVLLQQADGSTVESPFDAAAAASERSGGGAPSLEAPASPGSPRRRAPAAPKPRQRPLAAPSPGAGLDAGDSDDIPF